MAIARIKGNSAIRERPDSPEWDYNTQKVTCTRTFEGLYQDLLDAAPGIGSTMEGFNPDLLVENVKLKKAVSGKTTMTVVLETLVDSITNPPPPVQPVFEIEWTQLEKPIEQHPNFRSLFPDPTGQTTFTQAQITALTNFRAWENATDAATQVADYEPLTDGFKELAQKKMRGTTTYLLFAPVARITTLTRAVSLATKCGVIFDVVPGFTALPTGYQWLSTADRSTRTGTYGKWQRVQEWTGAEVWDVTLYTADDLTGGSSGSGDGSGGGGA